MTSATVPARTQVEIPAWETRINKDEPIFSLGSCFATEMGARLAREGFSICNNPFGVLYNPVSIANSIAFLEGRRVFTAADVIPRDTNPVRPHRQKKAVSPDHRPIAPAGGGYVSFYHHGSFACSSPEEFLAKANDSLDKASEAFLRARWVLLTAGTAWVYRHIEKDIIVSNCHKHPAWEFRRELLETGQIVPLWTDIADSHPEKQFILSVSPVRHRKDGLHGNQISKAILLLSMDQVVRQARHGNVRYFPSYEILTDELRDYSWYAEDLVHPSPGAIDYVWEKFSGCALTL